MGPLNALRKTRPNLRVEVGTDRVIDWTVLGGADAVLFQRPTTKVSVQIAAMAAHHGLPIVVEFDDDFFAIPYENPHHDDYMTPEVHANIKKILRLADVVTVATARLAKVFGELHHDVRIVPNALMTNMVGGIPDHAGKPRTPMVMWRGSKTHQIDLDAYNDDIVATSREFHGLQWAFQGYATGKVMAGIGKAAVRGGMLDNLEYFAAIAAVRPRVLMVPLADHAFNHSKSNIAGLEATFAGAVPVVPDWEEWQVPGWIRYTRETFRQQLGAAISMSGEESDNRWRQSANHISANLTIDVINGKRHTLLDELERKSFDPKLRAAKRGIVSLRRRDEK